MHQRVGHHKPLWTPPPNFAQVETGIYRSAYPTLGSVPFLRHIGIKTIVLLSIELLPGPVVKAISGEEASGGSTAVSLGTDGWMEDECMKCPMRVVCTADLSEWMNEYLCEKDEFSVSGVQRALDFALQVDFQPVLFTCPTGELQTSVVIGCMRRHQGWTLAAAMAECDLFVNVTGRVRQSVMSFIEHWDPEEHPIREEDIAERKRQLLLHDRPLSYSVRRHRKVVPHSASDPDSDNDEGLALGAPKVGQRGASRHSVAGQVPLGQQRGSVFDRSFASVARGSSVVEDGNIFSPSHVVEMMAPWYTNAVERRAALAEAILEAKKKVHKPHDPLPDPHVRYFGVLNPPAVDERTTFTKKSIVEDVD
uniref:Uncharacterized protein TCIL3000_11_14570 n=1 Tax=Trypanosoma congolense (strain IL3000) TaxID=1068625 RepID=G0V2R8_TRYCI|nr:unnamed protein product [Trypanosoma congolense IL3000]